MKKSKDEQIAPTKPPVQDVERISVPAEILTATLNYLSKRPYIEVYELIQAIQSGSVKL